MALDDRLCARRRDAVMRFFFLSLSFRSVDGSHHLRPQYRVHPYQSVAVYSRLKFKPFDRVDRSVVNLEAFPINSSKDLNLGFQLDLLCSLSPVYLIAAPMAEELQFSSRLDNKRKFDDPSAAPPSSGGAPAARRLLGFSAPAASPSPDNRAAATPPPDGIQLAKQRAQEIAARLFSDAEAKRPKVDNNGADDSSDKGFASYSTDYLQKPIGQQIPSQVGTTSFSSVASYGYLSASKKIEIPNGRVGVIIGKGGETIKYLQAQSGAKIQVTRDTDADPTSQTRMVELVGTSEQISRAENLINDVLNEADVGGSGIVTGRRTGGVQVGSEPFIMKVPNEKVGLIIGKGGETIKNMQAKSGARIQLIPLHPPPGDTSTERTVQIDGTSEQIESAKQLVNEVVTSNRVRNPMSGGYPQQPRPPTNWVQPGQQPPMQQPGYGYMQPGAYPGAPPQYNTQQPYGGYDYYNQQQPQQQQQQQQQPIGGSATSDNTGYNYGQAPPTYTSQGQDNNSGGYSAPAVQPGYPQHTSNNPQGGFDQQQGYGAAPVYGTAGYPTQDGSNSTYAVQGGPTQGPPSQQAPQVYAGQPQSQATSAPVSYQPQGTQPSYGYGQSGYAQPGYQQAPAQTGFVQPGYGQQQQLYGGAPPMSQPGYTQQTYGDSYGTGGGYSQPPVYSGDNAAHGAYDASPAVQAVSGVPKTSPQS